MRLEKTIQAEKLMNAISQTRGTEWENEAKLSTYLSLYFNICILERKARDEPRKIGWDKIVRTQYYTFLEYCGD